MKHLIGKKAIRTKPVDLQNGNKDWSWSSGSGVVIVNVTDTHVYITDNHSDKPYALDSRWLDGNWAEYTPSPGGTPTTENKSKIWL